MWGFSHSVLWKSDREEGVLTLALGRPVIKKVLPVEEQVTALCDMLTWQRPDSRQGQPQRNAGSGPGAFVFLELCHWWLVCKACW